MALIKDEMSRVESLRKKMDSIAQGWGSKITMLLMDRPYLCVAGAFVVGFVIGFVL